MSDGLDSVRLTPPSPDADPNAERANGSGDGPPRVTIPSNSAGLNEIISAVGRSAAPEVDPAIREPAKSAQDERGEHSRIPVSQSNRGIAPNLLSTAVFSIGFAVAVTFVLSLVTEPPTPGLVPSWWDEWKHIVAPVAGGVVALIAATLFAYGNQEFSKSQFVDPQVYGELRAKFARLDAQLPVLCPSTGPRICPHSSPLTCAASCDEAWLHFDFINSDLGSRGSRWVLGTGYIDLYRHLHAAEEALFLVQPVPDVVGNALYDALRLQGADKLSNWRTLQGRLLWAMRLVGGPNVPEDVIVKEEPDESELLLAADQEALNLTATGEPAMASASRSISEEPTSRPPPTREEQAWARIVLRDIRQAIDQFRDGERANLLRARNQLVWTGTITAFAGYALLILAILVRAPLVAVTSGIVYFLVGAGVGLFNQLRGDANRGGAAEDDFGFSRALLFYTPVLSGLAAVGGVMVVSLLTDAVSFGAEVPGAQTLDDIFNVREFGIGLVIAAVFGLAPDLLVDRLQDKADEYRAGLKGTEAAAREEPYNRAR